MASSSETLTLRLAGLRNELPAEAFSEVFRDTIAVLNELNKAVNQFGNANLEWRIVATGMSSPLFTTLRGVDPVAGKDGHEGPEVVAGWIAGLRHLESHDTRPQLFSEQALRLTSRIVSSRAKGLQHIEYASNGDTVMASPHVAANAAHALKRMNLENAKQAGEYSDFGSVEGTLKELSSLEGKDKIVLIDDLTGKAIACYFRHREVEDKARRAWKRRVVVSGDITYDRITGDVQQVRIHDIRELGTRDTLPQMEDLRGFDITGGIEPAEYIRGLRDGD